MKTKLKLCFTVVLLALAAFAFCFGAFNFGVNKASAADLTYDTKEAEKGTFAMVNSVKLRTDGDGFQFKAKMDKGTSESLSSNQKVYFILIPEIYKKTMGDLDACKAIARFTTGDNYGEYDIDNSLCLYVRAVRSELIDGYYYYYGGVSNLATVSQQKLNYYAVAVIETRNDDRTNGGKLTYNYTYATYDTAAPETNIYSTITSAILNVKEDYMAAISENYSWYGKEDYPLNVTSLEDYNKLVGKLNANLDLADIIIEFDADYASQNGAATITSEENKLYTVSFMNGDSVYKTYKVKNGAKITAPAVDPTKAADNVYTYSFDSWQVSGKNFDFANETITTETVLNANYTSLTKDERASRYTTDMEINGNYDDKPTLFEPIAIAEFAGKAVHFEFKFVTETGKFGFAIMDNPSWANITGTLTIEKKADGTIESNMGRVIELEDGWYAWELFSDFFAGDGAKKAKNVGLIYNQKETVQGEVLIDWRSLRAVEAQTYFSSNSKVAFEFSSGNGIVSQIPSENVTHNALKITNDKTHSQAQWMYFVLQLDPATIAKLDNAKELALKLKLQRNTAASNVTFNFRIAPGKLDNSGKWEPDYAHCAKTKDDMDGTNADGYSNNVVLDTWHNIRFLRDAFWKKGDTIAALKANGGKIVIYVELQNNNTDTKFEANTDFGYNLIIDDMTVTEYKYILDFENASDADLLQTRSYDSGRVSTCELSAEQKVSGEKSVKVYQNQHGALVVKIPDAMKDQLTADSKLTIRFMLAGVKTESGTEVPDAKATFAFYACGVPNPETDKKSVIWRDCQVAGNDWVANCEQGKWSTHEFSSELVQKIATNGYLWIECEMQNWQCYTFYVDFITLE